MSWVDWALVTIAVWLTLSLPVALMFGRLLRARDPFVALATIDEQDRRPLPPALRAAASSGSR